MARYSKCASSWMSSPERSADGAVLEVRLLVDVESGEVDGVLLRHDVAVPEPVAAAAPLEEVVEAVPHAAQVRAGDGDNLLLYACCLGDGGRGRPPRICGHRGPPPRWWGTRYEGIGITAAFGNLGVDGEIHHPLRRILAGYHAVVFRKFCAMQRKLIWSVRLN